MGLGSPRFAPPALPRQCQQPFTLFDPSDVVAAAHVRRALDIHIVAAILAPLGAQRRVVVGYAFTADVIILRLDLAWDDVCIGSRVWLLHSRD
jgi:hypothetical protein